MKNTKPRTGNERVREIMKRYHIYVEYLLTKVTDLDPEIRKMAMKSRVGYRLQKEQNKASD